MRIKSIAARFLLILTAVTAAAASCVKFDDSQIQSELADIKSRLASLEEKVNTNIADLWQIVNAQKDGILITSVTETDDAWILKFSNGKTATLSKGGTASAPAVGVKQDSDGMYYWTIYGDWLLDGAGNKLPVTGAPGATPQLKIEGGYWYVSTDGGKTWTKLDKATGEDGDSFFKDVTWDDDYVYLTLQNGTKFKLRRGDGLVASIAVIPDYSDGSVKAGTGLFTIRFKVEPESSAGELLYLDNKCFKLSAVYTETKASAGEFTTLPVHELDAQGGILTLTTDGESLAKEFAAKKLGISAALFISDESFAVTSGYFPLYPKNEYNGHGYVDLGLESGNKFADTNLGAENPWEPGNYYAWGELEPKKDYSWATYKWCDGSKDHMTKYNETDGLKSFADDNYKDDVARQEWGGEWHIPTKADWDELMDESKYTWTKTSKNGSKGYEIKSKKPGYEGESIFLPAAGCMLDTQLSGVGETTNYWSSTLYAKDPTGGAIAGGVDAVAVRYAGLAIRPVLGKYVPKSVKGVSLDRTSLTMVVGTKRQLYAKVEPAGIKNPKLVWTSADTGVATVAKNGTVTAVSLGTTTVTVKTVDGGYTATCTIKVVNQSDIVPEYVDLGLSVKWATFNVGATSPEDYGDYFAWGETETKEDYSFDTYKWGNDQAAITKYCTNIPNWGGSNPMDYKTVLDIEDDAARANWGDLWRMPTNDERLELEEKCSWTWTTQNGVKGMLVTGPNGNSIFLPAAGCKSGTNIKEVGYYGYYLSSSLYSGGPPWAWSICFILGQFHELNLGQGVGRPVGCNVRPVYGEFVPVSSISLDKTSLELQTGETEQLTVTISPSNATAKNLYLVTSKRTVAKAITKDCLVSAVAPGTATITVYASSGVSASCTVTVKPKPVNPEYVDLGLSVKWATFNVGATKPEESGDYFAWGETEPKSAYSWTNYKFELGTDWQGPFSKYVIDGSLGTADNKLVLDLEDDAAHVNWGENWRVPTDDEWTELRYYCTWTWTDNYNGTGIAGRIVTSKKAGYTNNSIFLPAVSSLYETVFHYWASTIHINYPENYDKSGSGDSIYFTRDDVEGFWESRYIGNAIRPVYGEFIPIDAIFIDIKTLEMHPGEWHNLPWRFNPSKPTVRYFYWVSSDKSVATVNRHGQVNAVAPGTVTITVYASSGVSASCTVTVKECPQAVDLGLPSGLKWASCNVGATRPEEFGDYFAWGETAPKADYSWSTYKWCKGAFDALTKYCFDYSYWGDKGSMDNLKILQPGDDAASVNMGGDWRTPTDSDWQELINNCTITWTDNYNGTGVAGSIFTGKNSGYTGVSIFIPAAGTRIDTETLDPGTYCSYWTSVLDVDREPHYARYFMSSDYGPSINSYIRADGRSVRAVMD